MSDSVNGTTFRNVMRNVPAPVVVVTARGADEARGITIGSFTSVALDPPLISFNVRHEGAMHTVLEQAERYAVHLLGEGQAYLAKHFAVPDLSGAEQFDSIPHRLDAHQTPLIDGVPGILVCEPYRAMALDDNTIHVGRVVDVEQRPDDGAVLYYQRNYRKVGSELRSSLLSPVNRTSSDSS